jgi:hypothetical protein
MSFCSPTATNKTFCYSLDSLHKIASAWNFIYKDNPNKQIIIHSNDNTDQLYEKIKDKMRFFLKNTNNSYWAWIDIIKILNKNKTKNNDISVKMKEIEKKELRPSQPIEWINNKTEWLSNFDIDNVLTQYSNDKSLSYKFHGVYTIDFGVKNSNGKSKYYRNSEINMTNIIKSGYKYFGFVTNLCKHDEPGTHWTSSFFVLDPSLNVYGAYYYDSVKRPIPLLLKSVFNDIKKQMETIYPSKKFNIKINNKQHQNSNTECGIFSIAFQTRWLILLLQNATNAKFEDVINFDKMKDNIMILLRQRFFRPNIKSILKK